MNYWMTTFWPPSIDEDIDNYTPRGVWLPDGRQQAGDDLEIGDKVLVYQSKSGRPEIKYIKGNKVISYPTKGKQGIIAITEVTGDLQARQDSKPSKYTFDKDIWWRWHADTEPISMNGFVSRLKVNEILGYKPKNLLRGFGDYKSGLKYLNHEKYQVLVEEFKKHPRKDDSSNNGRAKGHWGSHDQGGESVEHKALKEYVAANPSQILGEEGLKTFGIEYGFESGDRADLVFEDREGRIIGAEIELIVDDNWVGILQAIKYRYMLALTEGRRNFETRAFLIANKISNRAKSICDRYEVQYFEINNR